MSKFDLMFRKKITVNTDPQRRCYSGCNFSEKVVWSEWQWVLSLPTRERAEDLAKDFKFINPDRQYKVEEVE